jgi:4-hydroxybenzoate polyprenyltransferase
MRECHSVHFRSKLNRKYVHSFYAAVIQLLPLSCIYPLLKRVTYWPQAWLGFTMNFGLVAAWATVSKTVDYRLMAVMLAGAWW